MSETDPLGDSRVFFSIVGAIKFDVEAVAAALRTRSLTRLEAIGLANLLDGTHPGGLQLVMRGQGKGWRPIAERAAAYDRLIAVGHFVTARLAENCTLEEAVIDAAAKFNLSEPTVHRDLRLYRLRDVPSV